MFVKVIAYYSVAAFLLMHQSPALALSVQFDDFNVYNEDDVINGIEIFHGIDVGNALGLDSGFDLVNGFDFVNGINVSNGIDLGRGVNIDNDFGNDNEINDYSDIDIDNEINEVSKLNVDHGIDVINDVDVVAENPSRIVGGADVNIESIPYLLQLRKGGRFLCGASLVSNLFVITAAHCVLGAKPAQLVVVGGAAKLTESGVRRKVAKIMVPKVFTMRSMTKDIAVLKLANAMEGPNIKPIPLNTVQIKSGMKMKVSGWGLRSENGRQLSTNARSVEVPVVPKASCKSQYSNVFKLTQSMYCAAKPGVKDACSGDSGGPAVCGDSLCGVVSFGYGCARRKYPGVYTGVRAMTAFIKNAMKQ